jgi:hypothetical protein
VFDIDPMALEALAGLRPMPRTPLTINPCPEGYALMNLGGQLMCVLEGAEAMTPEDARRQALMSSSSQPRRFSASLPTPATYTQSTSGRG